MDKETMPTTAWPSFPRWPECFRPVNRLPQPSGVRSKYSGCESKEVCPYPRNTQSQTSDKIALREQQPLRDLASWQPTWHSKWLLSPDLYKSPNVTGRSAQLGVRLPFQSASCVRILHLTCACFFDLEKTSFEPGVAAQACNPSTQEVFKMSLRYRRPYLKNPGDSSEYQMRQSFYVVYFEPRAYFLMH